jgi:hypothetical protein
MEKRTPVLTEQLIAENPVTRSLIKTPKTPEEYQEEYGDEDDEDFPETDDDEVTDEQIESIKEGAYGCIFHPGIRCNGTVENRRFITKIQKKTRVTENEIYISRKIRKKIPGFRNYFAPIYKQCAVHLTQKHMGEIKKCSLFANETDKTIEKTAYVSNKILYLGTENIQTYFLDKALSYEGNSSVADPAISFWDELLTTHIRLLVAVQQLLDADILHMDLKAGNVMMEANTKNPIIIDFGIAIDHLGLKHRHYPSSTKDNTETAAKEHATTPHTAFYIYDMYSVWCIDTFICNYIVNVLQTTNPEETRPTKTEIETIVADFQYGLTKTYPKRDKTRNELFSTSFISESEIEDFRTKLVAYFTGAENYSAKTWKEIYGTCVRSTYKTWDNYGLAVMYLGILETVKSNREGVFGKIEVQQYGVGRNVLQEYIGILKDIVLVVPEKRLTVNRTIQLLTELRRRLLGAT